MKAEGGEGSEGSEAGEAVKAGKAGKAVRRGPSPASADVEPVRSSSDWLMV